jgi:antitoxin CcdA
MRTYNAHMARGSSRPRKTPTNVSVRSDLVARAKQLNLNLSGLLEAAIEQAIRDAERDAWLAANEAAIDAYNTRVEKHGVFSDDWRKF